MIPLYATPSPWQAAQVRGKPRQSSVPVRDNRKEQSLSNGRKRGFSGDDPTNVRESQQAASLPIDRAVGGGSRGRGPPQSVSAAEIQSQLLPRPLSSDATETTTLRAICLRRRAASPRPVPQGGPRAGVG